MRKPSWLIFPITQALSTPPSCTRARTEAQASAMRGEAAPAFVPAPHLPAPHQGTDRAWAAGDNADQLPVGTVTSPKLKTAKACW